jgi:hypothetical protein
LVLEEGFGVIVKWDGQRGNAKPYTVVWEGDADTGPRFREDTDDLERTLGEAFSMDRDTDADPDTISRVAELLARLQDAVRQHLVVSLRMSRVQNTLNCHLVILGQANEGVLFEHQSENLVIVLGDAGAFLEKEAPCSGYRPPDPVRPR